MFRKAVSAIMLFLLVISTFTLAFRVQIVKGDGGTIYIEPDGSIYPAGSPVSSLDNVTYWLTSNASSPIVILRDNMVFDGSGFEIVGSGSGHGIDATQRTNVTITDVGVTDFDYGIWLYDSSNCSVTDNNLTGNNWEGITLYYSDENLVSGNIAANDVEDSGIWVASSAFNTISLNQVTGNHIQGLYVDHDSHDNLFYENNVTDNNGLPWTYGIYLAPYSYSNTFTGNNIVNNPVGIYIHFSSNNTIFHNNFIANTLIHAYVEGNTPNTWDNGKQGNYWDNYTGSDSNHDGIGDIPYVIDANNTDYFPLMQPWVPYEGGTVCINADGSVSPLNAPLYSADNITYTLTGNISADADGIVIERDSIVLDGGGYTLQGGGYMLQGNEIAISNGIAVSDMWDVTIKNTNIQGFGCGIYLEDSIGDTVSGNNITNNSNGVFIGDPTVYGIFSYCTICGNNITNNANGGIVFDKASGNSIFGNNITNDGYGIWLGYSDYTSVSGNNITNKLGGLFVGSSNYTSISGNTFTSSGLFVMDSIPCFVENNTVNGKPLVYLESTSDLTVGNDAGEVVLVNCENITVEGLCLSKTDYGVELWETNSSTISGNNITNNLYGLILFYSSNISISGNNVTNNEEGISPTYSSGNNIYGNNITNNEFGIWLFSCSNSSISGNHVTNSVDYGIWLWYSNYSDVSGNNVAENAVGISALDSSNNRFYHNDFVDNAQQVVSFDSAGVWDDGYPSGGNYWSNYGGTDSYHGPFQNLSGGDGIGDTPYVIDTNNTDHYPLMLPGSSQITFDQTGLGSDVNGTVVTIDGLNYSGSSLPLSFWWGPGSVHNFSYAPSVGVSGGEQYFWNSTTGLSTLQSTSITITASGNVTGNYVTHKVIVTNITASTTWVYQGGTPTINVTVTNVGGFNESAVSVTLYYNVTGGKSVNTYPLYLGVGKSLTFTFTWNTKGVPCQNYTLTAVATIPTGSNTLSGETITIKLMGDINDDGVVNLKDIALVARAFGSTPGSSNWNPNADINGDGTVNMRDIALVARQFGNHV
ncbi:MAG: NosD domain-containing protein [Candidatus Bathyarchaeia archaeon]